IFAREGAMVSNPATQAVTLRLRDGFIHTTDGRAGTEYQTHFEFYDVNLDLRQMLEGARQRERDPKELTLGQLGRAVAAKHTAGRLLLPVVGRHLVREFLAAFALSLAAFVVIYVTAEFFDRLDSFLRHDVASGAIVRYFVFKLPLVVTQVTPFAVLVGALVGLGLLARQNEF